MKRLFVLSLMLVAFAGVANAQRNTPAVCDRDCLRGFVTQCLDAMMARNPKALPVAANMRFTEDTKTMTLCRGSGRRTESTMCGHCVYGVLV